ncbi:pyridoxamine 5'-phosphate oxidase family protein [Citromicrobium bathyomarinum]|uniref:pyridoxamine 5'-phosphate oxidase family protein n=1 Tax=Citromicrobium bathyomarinum TaxID=72174 RepID=UPI00315A9657
MIDTLDAILDDASRRLARAASDRRSAMHTPVVATGDADARVMVLRAFTPWTLRFHTDFRAPKVNVIADDPRVGVLFYDQAENVQIRVRGTATIQRHGAVADAAWEAGTNFARRCYLGEGPGTVAQTASSGLPTAFEGVEPTDGELLPARHNFAVMLVELATLDWFSLSHEGHRRARFDLAGGTARWVTP